MERVNNLLSIQKGFFTAENPDSYDIKEVSSIDMVQSTRLLRSLVMINPANTTDEEWYGNFLLRN